MIVNSHIFIYTGHDLDPNCLQKNTHHIETVNILLLLMKTFLGGANLRKITGAVEDIHPDDYDENVSFNQESTYIQILSPEKESCAEGCTFEYDHLYFFDKTFVYLTDFYGYRSYTSFR